MQAKLFMNGRSQAVRLPAAFRFEGDTVHIRRDTQTGDVILSTRAQGWDEFFEILKEVDEPDFMLPEERQQIETMRDPFVP